MNKLTFTLVLLVLIAAVLSATSYIAKSRVSKEDGKRFDKCIYKCSKKSNEDKFKKCMWKCWDPKKESNTLAVTKAPVKTVPDKMIDFAICYAYCTLTGGSGLACAYNCYQMGQSINL